MKSVRLFLLGLLLAGSFTSQAQVPTMVTGGIATLPISFQNRVYYSDNSELFSTDGTPAGTSPFGGVPRVRGSLNWFPLIVFNGRLYFSYSDPTVGAELWSTDGTAAGTRLVKDIYPGGLSANSPYSSTPIEPVIVGSRLLFKAFDSGTPSSGNREWWSTDGTTAGTIKLTAFNSPRLQGNPTDTEVLNGKLYFRVEQTNNNAEVWRTDGTVAGTIKLTNTPGNTYSGSSDMRAYGNYIYFTHHTAAAGHQLWRTDGTAAGTQLFFSNPGGGSAEPDHFNVVNNKLLFATYDGNARNLWATNGTTAGTQLLANVEVWVANEAFTLFNGRYYFSGASTPTRTGTGQELWATDGTTAGTVLVKDIVSGNQSGTPGQFMVAGNNLFFTADTPASGTELWVTNGTGTSTRQLSEIGPGTADAYALDLSRFANKVVFTGRPALNDYRLYESDGTLAGTRLLAPANATVTFGPLRYNLGQYLGGERLFATGADVFFTANFTGSYEVFRLGSGRLTPTRPTAGLSTAVASAYPNPLAEILHLRWTAAQPSIGPLAVVLCDALGRECLTNTWPSSAAPLDLAMPALPAGLYWLELRDATGLRHRQKLMRP